MYAGRNNLYEATIRRMVRESLEAKEKQFLLDHQGDTDELLLNYLRASADELGHPPHMKEIVGWDSIVQRFGGWEQALAKAGLPMPYTPCKPTQFALYIEEEQLQQKIYRQKKAERRRNAQIKQAQRAKKATEETQ